MGHVHFFYCDHPLFFRLILRAIQDSHNAKGKQKDKNDNSLRGDNVILDSTDNIIFSNHTPIACIGVDHLIVVNTENGVLVCDKNKAQEVRMVVEMLKEKNSDKTDRT